MARLTERSAVDKRYYYYPYCFQENTCGGEGCKKEMCDFSIQVCNRLGAYEDTELEPEEVQQYRVIGTPEECGEAVAKQTAKKPINNDRCTCPSCGTYNETIKKRRNTVVCDTVYCWHCGQAIECRGDIDLV